MQLTEASEFVNTDQFEKQLQLVAFKFSVAKSNGFIMGITVFGVSEIPNSLRLMVR